MKITPEKLQKYWPHCWHWTETQSATWPPTEVQTCCYCGDRVTLRRISPPGHGSKLPPGAQVMDSPPQEKCPARKPPKDRGRASDSASESLK